MNSMNKITNLSSNNRGNNIYKNSNKMTEVL